MNHELAALAQAIALAVATLLPIINPIGSAPVFLSMTPGASEQARSALARAIARNSVLLLLVAMLGGSYVLNFFGLSLPVIKIAGGLLVISTGWSLVRADQSPDAGLVASSPAWNAEEIASRSFYPLTFPLTVGPGTISVAITLGAGARVSGSTEIFHLAGLLVGVVLVTVAIFLSYRYAYRLIQVLGTTGSLVLLRMSAFILLSVGVQIFSDGLSQRFHVLR